MYTYSSSRGLGNLALVFVTILVLLVGCAVMASGLGDAVDGVLNDKDAARVERLRMMEVEAERQKAQGAEEQRLKAEAQVEIEREKAAQEEAKERQEAARVERINAEGNRAERFANAYTTRKMADASYRAIERQGRLLTMTLAWSAAQRAFFWAVVGLAIAVGAVGVLVVHDQRKRQ